LRTTGKSCFANTELQVWSPTPKAINCLPHDHQDRF